MNRRAFLRLALSAGGVTLLSAAGLGCALKTSRGKLSLAPLPYPSHALEPYISRQTIELHYGKHHQGYVDQANRLISGTALAGLPLTQVIRKAGAELPRTALFNQAAQVFNHSFYWSSMKPRGGGPPAGRIGQAVENAFGSYRRFCEQFREAALAQFGSGWTWLAQADGTLTIVSAPNADNPILLDQKPLLNLDVWEHAYYLDYQNRRSEYIEAYLEHLVNWEFAEANLADQSG
jgi:Fe-Mn family superoxide dismutase